MLSIIGKLMHPLFSQRAKAPGRSQMLTPSGMLKLRFRLGTKFLAFESSGHLPQIATVVSICFNLFRSGFHSFRWRQCKQLQAVAAGIAGDCRGRRAGAHGKWLLLVASDTAPGCCN
jgi:hypothetical protein